MSTYGCAFRDSAKNKPQGKAYYEYFDTVSYIYNYAGDSEERMSLICEEGISRLEYYNDLFDIYYEYSGISNLRTVNLNAGISPVVCDPELIDFLKYAKDLYYRTEGKMNIMLGAVLRLWHDCRANADNGDEARVPSQDELSSAFGHTSIDSLVIDPDAGTVYISDPEASIDVGAIGKGYATEKTAEYLESIGAYGYVLNIGGNIRTVGLKQDGSGWVTGIRDPSGNGSYALKVNLGQNVACVTSGDYERYYYVDGVKYHHIIDPDTLYPADYFASVSIICRDSGLADALSTALFCMSYEDGLRVIAAIREVGLAPEGIDVIWIFADGSIKYTDGIGEILAS